MIFEPWNPGFLDFRIALELAIFDWFQHLGYESCSVYVKKLDFEQGISKYYHSWTFPEIFWNPGYHLEMAIFWTFWRVGHQFNRIFVTKHEFCLKNWKMSCFWCFQMLYISKSKNYKKYKEIWHFSILEAKLMFSDKN